MNYEKYMKKCIRLAKKGEGKTSPNPLVGCVILDKNGKEISNGYHKKYGEAHAEADALKKLNNKAQGATLIVNLEPCSHHGKTPPCADLIIKSGVKRLVIGMQDPNPIVAGNGIKKCKEAGIEVIQNVLKKEAELLNEVFIKNMTENKPFIAVKTATTLDGKIATSTGDSKWITSEKARNEVQKIRNRYDAIFTTSSTVIKDNPSTTCRLKNGKNPIRVVLDRELKTNFTSKIYQNDGTKIYIAYDKGLNSDKIKAIPPHISHIKCKTYNKKLDLDYLMNFLYKEGVSSILIEAGGKLNGEVVSEGLADKIYQFIAPKLTADKDAINAFEGRSIKKISDTLNFEVEGITDYNPDFLVVYYRG